MTLSEKRRELLVSLAREHQLSAADTAKEYVLTERAVVHYSNPVRDRGSTDGVTFLWLDRRLPVAASSFSIRRPDDSLRFESCSLNEKALRLDHDGRVIWSPKNYQSEPIILTGSQRPSTVATRRLAQMRQIGRQFEATCTRPRTLEVTTLRLLSQPIYRFSDPETDVVDGALFAFVISNDPELLLRLVATEKDDQLVWKYSFARMTSLEVEVQRDGVTVWQVPNYYESGRSMVKPYIEGGVRSERPVPTE